MALLNSLKIVAAKRPQAMPVMVVRRNKLLKKLHEQQMLAEAVLAGSSYNSTRYKKIVDRETGISKTVEVPRRVRAWWWTGENGKVCLNIKYGSGMLALEKGKYAIEVGTEADLPEAIKTLKAAVEAGELDAQIEAVSGAVRSGFGK